MKIKSKETRDMLLAIATMFQEKREELARLDSVIGDGDHGISMARGAKKAFQEISDMDDEQPVNEYFKVYGRAMVAEIGGAIGPLFGMIFTEIGKCVKGKTEITPEAFAQAIENSKNKVMDFGGAKPNDKTMVDAMVPACEAARSKAKTGANLYEVVRAAADAAKCGVENTIAMQSRRGRSKFLQEKSIGHQDAGATSYYYLLNRMADYLNGSKEYVPYVNQKMEKEKQHNSEAKQQVIKFINDPDNLVEETVQGYVEAYNDRMMKLPEGNVVARKEIEKNKVGVIIGNGSGHEPACLGFIGTNMLDANAYGGVFAAPGPYNILRAIKAADTGKGVCVLVSAHAGDILNAKMAIDMAEDDGIKAEALLLYDDVASAPKAEPLYERRGSIGTNTRSIAAAMSPGHSPITGEEMFAIEPGEVLVGLGVHGEAALMTFKNEKCSEIAERMICELIEDKPYQSDDEVAVIVNGTGKTTMMEMMIFYTTVNKYLTAKGIKVYRPLIGSYITTQDMGGIGLAICKVNDEMKKQWVKPTNAPHFPCL